MILGGSHNIIIVENGGVYSGREGSILRGSHNIIVVEKRGVYSRREGSHIVVEKGYILRERGRFWEGRTYTFVEMGGIFWER